MISWKSPRTIGVPEIIPPEDRFKPVGSDPEIRDQVYGPVPPEATRVVL
jgi:hypothetical protein